MLSIKKGRMIVIWLVPGVTPNGEDGPSSDPPKELEVVSIVLDNGAGGAIRYSHHGRDVSIPRNDGVVCVLHQARDIFIRSR